MLTALFPVSFLVAAERQYPEKTRKLMLFNRMERLATPLEASVPSQPSVD